MSGAENATEQACAVGTSFTACSPTPMPHVREIARSNTGGHTVSQNMRVSDSHGDSGRRPNGSSGDRIVKNRDIFCMQQCVTPPWDLLPADWRSTEQWP